VLRSVIGLLKGRVSRRPTREESEREEPRSIPPASTAGQKNRAFAGTSCGRYLHPRPPAYRPHAVRTDRSGRPSYELADLLYRYECTGSVSYKGVVDSGHIPNLRTPRK
jgi:hypothetical protein